VSLGIFVVFGTELTNLVLEVDTAIAAIQCSSFARTVKKRSYIKIETKGSIVLLNKDQII
jgi:hypothetical protein